MIKTRHVGTSAKLYRVAWVILISHHLMSMIVGISGFVFEPSPSIERTTGNIVVGWLWSSIFVIFGALALLARLREKVTAEMWAIGSIALARLLWCVTILVSAYYRQVFSGVQVGLALGATSMFMTAWALFTIVWVRTGLIVIAGNGRFPVELLQDQLKSIAKQAAKEERERRS